MTEETTTEIAGSNTPEPASGATDTVAYASYKKVLSEKKNLQAKMSEINERLAAFESDKKQREEAQLIEEKKYQELLTSRDEELVKTRQELSQWQNLVTDSRKIAAFTDALGAKIESKYHAHIPLDKIEIDEHGQVDGNSIASAVDSFKKEHARLIIDQKRDLPNHQPVGGDPKISLEEFKRLGQEKGSKEMLKHVENVFPEILGKT